MTDYNTPTPRHESGESGSGTTSDWTSAEESTLYTDSGVNTEATTGSTATPYGAGPVGDEQSDVVGGAYSTGAGGTGATYGTTSGAGQDGSKTEQAKQVAGDAAQKAADVKDTAVEKAAEVKDVALERGAEVAAVAKEELADLAAQARSQVRSLYSQATQQVREQADTGRHQLAELLHSLSSELGEMASKSTQDGPVTALAKQAAHRGGELSHWLENTEPHDLLVGIRRFARRRPFLFLGGAALAGVLVGRLGRGLMGDQDEPQGTRLAAGYSGYSGTSYPAGSTYAAGTSYPAGGSYAAGSTYPAGTSYPAGQGDVAGSAGYGEQSTPLSEYGSGDEYGTGDQR